MTECKKHRLPFPCLDCEIERLEAEITKAKKLSAELHRKMKRRLEAREANR